MSTKCTITHVSFLFPIIIRVLSLLYVHRHIVIWKKVDEKWLAHIDMWNTDFAVTPQMDDECELKVKL